MNDYQLWKYCSKIAAEIVNDCDDPDHAMQLAHESADGSEYSIYHYKAHLLCLKCNTDMGEELLQEIGQPENCRTYNEMASAIAYGEIYSRISLEVSELIKLKGK